MKENCLKYKGEDFIPIAGLFLYESRTSEKAKGRTYEALKQNLKGKFLIAYNVALGSGIWYGLEQLLQ